jgi:hypothetical protein
MSRVIIERDRLRIHQFGAGYYEVYRRKRTRYYYAGIIRRVKRGEWEIKGPDIAITRHGMCTLQSSIYEFERNMK